MAPTFLAERDGPVLVVSFDSPPYHVIGRQMVTELTTLVRGLEHDSTIRSVVLTGRERGMFPAVNDVSETSSVDT